MSQTPTFTAVRTEGGLLPPDLLERVRALDSDLPGLRAEDYGLAPGERLNDAIVRSWTRLNGAWQTFADRLDKAPESETTFESQTRKLWTVPLLQELGFGQVTAADPVVIDDKTYPVSHRASAVALHLVGARVDLDRRAKPGARPAHGMVQEFLNRDSDHLWAILTNGTRIRLLRDSSSLTRQAYCEFDLEAMFRGQEYADFALCWLICHASRFAGDPASTCILEKWSTQARTDGTRALDQLRSGVEAAIEALGNGFLAHPRNQELRRQLRDGEVSTKQYQHELLRLVYRLLFLQVAEARGLLHAPGTDRAAIDRYHRFYSVSRLVELGRRQRGTAHGDLWDGLRVVFDALAGPGLPALGLNGLGSFLWAPDSLAAIGTAELPNRYLLDAIDSLSTVRPAKQPARAVDYRNLGAEELGSIYESLLELHPVIDGTRFSLGTAAGNERKTTGSYYTPSSLIRVLLDSALDPVLDEAENGPDPEAALLDLKVLDPAAGSGHFLIAAAHRIAHRLAAVRSGETEPSPDEMRHALRDVIGRCIYGIDVNPMAVELCKVSLWMEATEPGKPLSFLDHHIVCGNSLLGTTPALLRGGLPDEAFKALEGDDKAVVTALKKRNKQERTHQQQGSLDFGDGIGEAASQLASQIAALDSVPDDSVEDVRAKEHRYAELLQSESAARARFGADAWCAAFVAPKVKDAPTLSDATVRLCRTNPDKVPFEVHQLVQEMVERYGFLHLHLAFPGVFSVPAESVSAENETCGWSGGFDIVLGNPPWERVKLQEKEWFAARDPEIAAAPNASARKRLIEDLASSNPDLHDAFLADTRRAEGEGVMLRMSGRFPLCGRGDVNTYAVFAEFMSDTVASDGWMGVVVPTGIATDDTTKDFFWYVLNSGRLRSLFSFENEEKIFPGVHNATKFSLLAAGPPRSNETEALFLFFARSVAEVATGERVFAMDAEDVLRLNPATRTCPVFRSGEDAEIMRGIYDRMPVLAPETSADCESSWSPSFTAMFHMSGDSGLFRDETDLGLLGWTRSGPTMEGDNGAALRLYEAKMGSHYNHRWADHALNVGGDRSGRLPPATPDLLQDPTYTVSPKYWIDQDEVTRRRPWENAWFVGVRSIARNVDARTLIPFVVPDAAVSGKLPLLIPRGVSAKATAAFVGLLSSFVSDYVVRNKVGGSDLTWYALKQMAIPSPAMVTEWCDASLDGGLGSLVDRVVELSYTAWDLSEFAQDLGYSCPPFHWNEERRMNLQCEVDAIAFCLYGVTRSEAEHILDSFGIVNRKDELAFGERRTRRLILERFDLLQSARAEGIRYRSVVNPPPADASLCHLESTRPRWAE